MSSHQTSNLSSSPRSPGNHHPFHHTSSPPLPNIHSLSISSSYGQQQHYAQPGPQSPISNGNGSGNGAGDYRYNGVFGPPAGSPPTQSQGWGHDKSGSRSGLPTVSAEYIPRSLNLLISRTGTILRRPLTRTVTPPQLSPLRPHHPRVPPRHLSTLITLTHRLIPTTQWVPSVWSTLRPLHRLDSWGCQ